MQTRTQKLQIFLAAVLLPLGLSVYLFDRPVDRVYFVPDWWKLSAGNDQVFGSIGNNLPSFVHVVVFILVTSALLAPWRFRIASICLLWFSFDSLFELAQHDAIASLVAGIIPGWFQDVILLENTVDYFLAGTFDLLDLLSIAFGSIAAYLILRFCHVQEYEDDTN